QLARNLFRVKLLALVLFIVIVLLTWGCMLLLEQSFRARLLAFVGLGPRLPVPDTGHTPHKAHAAPGTETPGARSRPAPPTVGGSGAAMRGGHRLAPAGPPAT